VDIPDEVQKDQPVLPMEYGYFPLLVPIPEQMQMSPQEVTQIKL
jgi:hypothetical protein